MSLSKDDVPTITINYNEIIPACTFMLDTGSGPNLIKETVINNLRQVNRNSLLKLQGISDQPVYTLGEIILNILDNPVIFHLVDPNFPIKQSGILGSDFFDITGSKIDYARNCMYTSGIEIPFIQCPRISWSDHLFNTENKIYTTNIELINYEPQNEVEIENIVKYNKDFDEEYLPREEVSNEKCLDYSRVLDKDCLSQTKILSGEYLLKTEILDGDCLVRTEKSNEEDIESLDVSDKSLATLEILRTRGGNTERRRRLSNDIEESQRISLIMKQNKEENIELLKESKNYLKDFCESNIDANSRHEGSMNFNVEVVEINEINKNDDNKNDDNKNDDNKNNIYLRAETSDQNDVQENRNYLPNYGNVKEKQSEIQNVDESLKLIIENENITVQNDTLFQEELQVNNEINIEVERDCINYQKEIYEQDNITNDKDYENYNENQSEIQLKLNSMLLLEAESDEKIDSLKITNKSAPHVRFKEKDKLKFEVENAFTTCNDSSDTQKEKKQIFIRNDHCDEKEFIDEILGEEDYFNLAWEEIEKIDAEMYREIPRVYTIVGKVEDNENNNIIMNNDQYQEVNNEQYRELSITEKINTDIETIKELLRLEQLSQEEENLVHNSIKINHDRFHIPGDALGATNVLQHSIPTTDDKPINTRQYRFPPIHKDEINKQVQELLEGGILKHSQSPYNSPVWIVPKKPDSQGNKRWRMVLDFRALNEKTIADAYPLPNIIDILDQLGGAQYFSVFDLVSGFHQIKMSTEDAHKTAFTTPFGHYEFDRMPFGLRNAPATFQRLMDLVLTGLQGRELFVYLDDIVIYAKTLKEHEQKFNILMQRLRDANLKLQPDKCEFLRKEVGYLGHIIGRNGVKPDPKKLEAVRDFPTPKNVKNIRQFLGLAGYYRRFILGFSKIARPLSNLLKDDVEFNWNIEQINAFEILKDKLCLEPVLIYPDFTKPFILTTDASGYAIGGILSQGQVNKDRPIAYASRTLTDCEMKYGTYEKEALAIVYCVNHFRPYLYGRKFTLVTDHKPLMWFQNAKDVNMRILRWRLKLAEYDYEVIYKAGKTNVNADALSRNPVEYSLPCNVITRSGNKSDISKPKQSNKKIDLTTEKGVEYLRRLLEDEDDEEPVQSNNEEIDNLEEEYQNIETSVDELPEYIPQTIPNDLAVNIVDDGQKPGTSKDHQSLSDDEDSDHMVGRKQKKGTVQIEIDTSESDTEGEEEENLPSVDDHENPMNNDDIMQNEKSKSTRIGNVIQSRDLIFLRKDSVGYFVDTDGNPLDSGAKRLAERKELIPMSELQLNIVKYIKKGDRYLFALPVSDGSGMGPTQTLQNIHTVLLDLYQVAENLKISSISISKSETINNVAWENILSTIQSVFSEGETKIIICLGLIKYPPTDLRQHILEEMHTTAVGGHRGVTKTYNRIRQNYYWENLKVDVQKFIQQCLQCQLKKLVRVKTKQPMIITDTPGTVLDKIAMDIVGPLPATRKGNTCILTIQDQLSKYCMGIPIPDQKAITVADAFVKRFICTLGAPKAVLTDQGRNFLSELMKGIAKRFKIRKLRTTAFHPQSNGSLERSHHALGEYLKQFTTGRCEWDEWVDLAMFNFNTSIHEGTKHTPYELMFGRIARIPSSEPLQPVDKMTTYDDYLITLATQLHEIQQIARNNLIQSKEKSKVYYDRKLHPLTLKRGDLVFLLKGNRSSKFSDQYTGPHEVIEILNKGNVRIKINKNTRVVHSNRLKPSHIKITSYEETV